MKLVYCGIFEGVYIPAIKGPWSGKFSTGLFSTDRRTDGKLIYKVGLYFLTWWKCLPSTNCLDMSVSLVAQRSGPVELKLEAVTLEVVRSTASVVPAAGPVVFLFIVSNSLRSRNLGEGRVTQGRVVERNKRHSAVGVPGQDTFLFNIYL
jgi:hypothetical protein